MIRGSKIQLIHVDEWDGKIDPRYSLDEIDIMCRNCSGNLGQIKHICPKKLVTECSNCGYVATIDTSFMRKTVQKSEGLNQ